MASYLNAFYGAVNGLCGVMTSVTYANEVQGVNMTTENNKLLGHEGFTVGVQSPWTVTASKYNSRWMTVSRARSWALTAEHSRKYSYNGSKSMGTSAGAIEAFNFAVKAGYLNAANCPYLTHAFDRATLSELVDHEQSLAKGATASTMRAFEAVVQAANVDFSNVKGRAAAGVSLINGAVQNDGNELAAAAGLLASVLQSLASPVTVS